MHQINTIICVQNYLFFESSELKKACCLDDPERLIFLLPPAISLDKTPVTENS